MGNPAFIPLNWLTTGTVRCNTTAGATVAMNASFPLTLLRDGKPGTRAKMSASTVGMFSVEFTSAKSPTAVMIQNHNLVGAGATVYLSSAAAIGGPWTNITDLSTLANTYEKFAMTVTPGTARAFWGLNVTALGTLTDPIAVGEFWIGDLQAIGPGVQWGGTDGVLYREISRESEYGFRLAYFLSSSETYAGAFTAAFAGASRTALAAFYEAIKGTAVPFVFIPDIDGYGTGNGKAYVATSRTSQSSIATVAPSLYAGAGLEIVEQSYGRPVV